MYIHVKPEDCHEILEKTVSGAGRSSTGWCTTWTGWPIPGRRISPSNKKQHRVVLENCGSSDAEDIEEYIAKGGYAGFERRSSR